VKIVRKENIKQITIRIEGSSETFDNMCNNFREKIGVEVIAEQTTMLYSDSIIYIAVIFYVENDKN
jgi:hypothetical protein